MDKESRAKKIQLSRQKDLERREKRNKEIKTTTPYKREKFKFN